jgi:tryptophan-rich sensory protein
MNNPRRPILWKPILAAAMASIAVAALGGLMTEIGPWYHALQKPSWQPPDWAFGPAWTLIFALLALANAYAWVRTRTPGARRAILALNLLNGVLNVLWSILFFRLHRPDLALIEVVPFWLSILAMLVVLGRRSSLAGWLLVPYLAWVAFAGYLNWTIVQLNGPFG